jgi:hypothetical protein
MAHWAEIDENNIVVRVVVGDNNDPNGDEGYQWLLDNLGGTWLKTSYNTRNGKRLVPHTHEETNEAGFRGNYAGIGYFYDSSLDAFIPPKPTAPLNGREWILDKETCNWIKSNVIS